MQRGTLAVIWAFGALLAVALYAAGPDHFIAATTEWLHEASAALDDTLRLMSAASYEVLRSAALALLAVFVLLAIVATQRGLRARRALVAVSGGFLLLVATGHPGAAPRWLAALLLAGCGALVMTRRLLPGTVAWRR